MMNLGFVSIISSLVMVFCGLWSFTYYHKHLLNSLLSLEFMMLEIFRLLSLQMSNVGSEVYLGSFL